MQKSALNHIIVRGAREHNLKNINLEIPKNKLVVFTGVSGSGKSSMAMDTIYAEGQRRYVESLSAYARQFLGVMDKPDVDSIEGLSPAIAIDQKTTSKNPRSTVGTITEVYDFLRLLYARIGHPYCPNCGREIQRQSSEEILNSILQLVNNNHEYNTQRGVRFYILSPVVKDRKGEFSSLIDNLKKQGIVRARIDGTIVDLKNDINLIKTNKHTIEAVVSRHIISKNNSSKEQDLHSQRSTIFQSLETALRLSNGNLIICIVNDKNFEFGYDVLDFEDHLYSENFACPVCNISLPDLEPRSFSFNSPHGACNHCDGLGVEKRVEETLVLNPKLSISEGGVLPWNKLFEHQTWSQSVIVSVSNELNFSLKTAIKDLSKEDINILLYGTGNKKFTTTYFTKDGRKHVYEAKYEGVINNLQRRYKETTSEFVRGEIEKYMVLEPCPVCFGARLKKEALSVTIDNKNIWEISNLSINNLSSWIEFLNGELTNREKVIAQTIIKEISYRLKFLSDVGLGYLTIGRSSSHLSGGEAQRIRLASQIGSGLTGVLYVLDEPSIGLHQVDQSKLINTLLHLRDLGNTVIVVEHDEETMLKSDFIFDFGPGAGEHGGALIASGTPAQLMQDKNSITGKYLSGEYKVGKSFKNTKLYLDKILETNVNTKVTDKISGQYVTLLGACGRNLKNVDLKIPLGKIICVTGVSGSGKSTLIMDTFYTALRQYFGLKIEEKPEPFKDMLGVENITNVIAIDQSPIGRTPKSNPATYTKTFDHIRDLFSKTQEARIRGYKQGRFSFNVKGGRCEACLGDGQIKIEMQFMPDVYVDCEVCGGKRYNREALEITYKQKNIAEVLSMTVEEALVFFDLIPSISRRLQTLFDVGLGYIRLGQPAPTLSGGEAQRIKLASELSKRSSGSTLYILDEPTTGLHFADLENLIQIFKRLTARGNTVLIIEHNLDVIANSDYVIDLGPEGGDKGGKILFSGETKDILSIKESYTGKALNDFFEKYNK